MLTALLLAAPAAAQQTNYQFAPAPIPYPFFEPNRTDFKITGVYGTLSAPEVSIKGGGGLINGRKALNENFALDAQLGLIGMSGEVPGFALPFYYSGNLWNPENLGKGELQAFSFPIAGNVEFQILRSRHGSVILFGGPNLVLTRVTIQTPYNARTGGTAAARTKFTTEATAVLGGIQMGMQAGIPLKAFQLVPYVMANYESGSASFAFKEGYKGVTSFVKSGVVDIEPFSFFTVGGDIVYSPWGISLGTLFQQASANKEQNGYKLVVTQLSWHFRGKS